jgi:HEAT repeat protein
VRALGPHLAAFPDLVAALLRLLTDMDPFVRGRAAEAAGRFFKSKARVCQKPPQSTNRDSFRIRSGTRGR